MIDVKSRNSLKRYRQFAGYTQRTFSKALNMPLSTYQQKEQGKIRISDEEKLSIKHLLSSKIGKLTIDDIFFS